MENTVAKFILLPSYISVVSSCQKIAIAQKWIAHSRAIVQKLLVVWLIGIANTRLLVKKVACRDLAPITPCWRTAILCPIY